ncbi:non-ribosomal peptide synthetase [Chondromyces crocatus]|uniref:Carrier domain-containing protein n=1 Tax=Chondromyces crocatus TaxID=52 RepID=A0A0K1EKH1_CHOCO|nr:non-ribosomal peptide synthetase [Chondromyces crocatus]AKT41370.1 uncharacterized protein CMC5_055700 [Chondromyces crocatus]
MNALGAFAELVRRGAQITADGDRLRYRTAKGVLGDADLRMLKEHKPEILRFLAGRKAVRLSSVQERLWFLSRLDPSGVGYSFAFTYRIRGPLDVQRFGEALQVMLRRHPALGAVFVEIEGTPLQLLGAPPAVETPCIDCRDESLEVATARIRNLLAAPFDLARGPLLRSCLARISPEEHLWTLTMHHLVADGRTFGILVRDLSLALATPALDVPPSDAPRLDYADFVEWERLRADSPERDENLDYWVRQLGGTPDLDLPLDHPRPPVRTHRGGQATIQLPNALLTGLEAFARSEEATRFSVLLAVSFALLRGYSRQEDFAVGSPHANRADAGFEDTAGCFVSTLVLRADLSGDPSFRDLVRRISEMCIDAWDHQDASYERLVSRLAPARDTSRNALFQVFFALQNVFEPLEIPGASAEMLLLDTGLVQFDVELHFFLGGAGKPTGILLYNRDLFEDRTMRLMAERWTRLAEALLEQPDQPLGKISFLSADERQRALDAFGDTRAEYPRATRVEDLFAEQVRRTPDRIAAICAGERVTYAALEARVEALAGAILSLREPGSTLGILLDRSVDMLASLLAIPRAGAAFLPIDPALPPERIAFMLEDSGVQTVLTRSEHLAALPRGVGWVLVDALPASPGADPSASGARSPSAADAAYLLYTSGSTGKPKGVLVSHRSLVNLLHAMAHLPGIAPDDVLCAVTSLSFDIALLELLLPLVRGATVVIAQQHEASDPIALAALLETTGITVMQATPSSWSMLLDAGWTGRPTLRALCGGEPLSRALADRLLDACAEVWNLYGPTETTIWSTRWRVTRGGPVSLGIPIENTRLYLLDMRGALCPPGLPGELWIAGDGLSRGYLNRAGETARRFQDLHDLVGHPEPAYRTGDLVRMLPDGSLVYLGRTDHQLKVRGHRIEPEEIEHTLRAHPGVREAVATQTATGALVAHVLAQGSPRISEPTLREHAARSLPGYMVPQRCLIHDRFPRTPSGKIDRKALSLIPLSPTIQAPPLREPPLDDIEASVADLFTEVLGVTEVGRWDNFFELGGHSLVAARVLYGLQQRHSVQIGLHELFQRATVSGLATRVKELVQRRTNDDFVIGEALARLESMSEEEAAQLFAQLVGQ